jgi:hypothetical protein
MSVSRIQLALNVANIDEAIAFYSKLFDTEPAKVRPGVEVSSTDQVRAANVRLSEAGLAPAVEEETTCCYAVQDKVWVNGPGGEPWEIYTVLADAPVPEVGRSSQAPGEAACCTPDSSPVALSVGARTCC